MDSAALAADNPHQGRNPLLYYIICVQRRDGRSCWQAVTMTDPVYLADWILESVGC